MAEYIEREALRTKAVYMFGFGPFKYVPLSAIESAPAADVAPVVHGRWEFAGGDDDENLYGWCSVCNKHWKEEHIENFNYCPNCGARMDGE